MVILYILTMFLSLAILSTFDIDTYATLLMRMSLLWLWKNSLYRIATSV